MSEEEDQRTVFSYAYRKGYLKALQVIIAQKQKVIVLMDSVDKGFQMEMFIVDVQELEALLLEMQGKTLDN